MNKTITLRLFFIISIIIWISFPRLKGQTIPYSFNLDKVSGLASQTIYDVYQDKSGFIWFGNNHGISRYDGLQIKNYSSKDFSVKSVSNISQDSQGRIWFQNFNGTIFYIDKETLHIFGKDKANGFLRYAIIENHLFVAGKDAVKIYRLSDFLLVKTLEMDMKSFKHSIADKENFYLIGDHIKSVNINAQIQRLQIPQDYTTKISAPLPIIHNDKLYIFSKFGQDYLELKNNSYQYHRLPFKNIFTQNVASINNSFWLCSTKGLYELNVENSTFKHYFPESNISNIIKTSTGRYWISSLNKGAYYVENFNTNFIPTQSTPLYFGRNKDKIFFSTHQDEIYKLNNNLPELVFKGISDHAINSFKIDSINNKLLISSSKFIIKSKGTQLEHIMAVKAIAQLDAKYYAVSASGWNGVIFTNPNLRSDLDSSFKGLSVVKEKGIHFITLIENENGKSNILKKHLLLDELRGKIL